VLAFLYLASDNVSKLYKYLLYQHSYRAQPGRPQAYGVAHSKIARVARVVFVLYVVGRAY